jgi:hypothetical protein
MPPDWRDAGETGNLPRRAAARPRRSAPVFPTHWDRFNVPYSTSQQPAIERLQSFLAEVRVASPSTRVIVPEYFQPIVVKGGQNRPAQNK